MRDLSRILASIVFAAPLGGCVCPKVAPIDETVPIPAMPTATTMMDLVACQADAMQCDPLCRDMYDTKHGGPVGFTTCELVVDAGTGAESVHYVAEPGCVGGRRPAGYRRGQRHGPAHLVGAYLAQQAELEVASVRAFEDLLADLVAHDAPASLRRATLHAARDEKRHGRICDALARRYGTIPRYPALPPASRRERRELAVDNAVEGCVRETFGSVVAGYQARTAADPMIRSAMRRIWRDEANHAALSWRVHRWLAPRLDDGDRRAVRAAVRDAKAELAAGSAEHPDLQRVAGLPDSTAARALFDAVDKRVWSGRRALG